MGLYGYGIGHVSVEEEVFDKKIQKNWPKGI